jgi:hypothetical protein
MVLADKFSVGMAVAALRFCDQRRFGFRVWNYQLPFLSCDTACLM